MTLNAPYYDPRVVIYKHKCFIRLATGLTPNQIKVFSATSGTAEDAL